MKRVRVKSAFVFDGALRRRGDVLDLRDSEAMKLLSTGRVELHEGGTPANTHGPRFYQPQGVLRRPAPAPVVARTGSDLRDLIESSGRTVSDVADEMGVSRPTLYRAFNEPDTPLAGVLHDATERIWPR